MGKPCFAIDSRSARYISFINLRWGITPPAFPRNQAAICAVFCSLNIRYNLLYLLVEPKCIRNDEAPNVKQRSQASEGRAEA